jgi:uncharacterized Zn finger protein
MPSATRRTARAAMATATRQRLLLRRIMIRCPETGLSTDTGFELTQLPQIVGEQMLVDCLECGQDHRWTVDDARLD